MIDKAAGQPAAFSFFPRNLLSANFFGGEGALGCLI
jgi:hypothetical protein